MGIAGDALGPDLVRDDRLHRRHHIEVEQPVHQPHLQRRVGILGNRPEGSGMMPSQIFDDDAGFRDRPVPRLVPQHGELPQRPQRQPRLRHGRIVQHARLESRAVLVKGDQHLPAAGGEGVVIENHVGSSRRPWVRAIPFPCLVIHPSRSAKRGIARPGELRGKPNLFSAPNCPSCLLQSQGKSVRRCAAPCRTVDEMSLRVDEPSPRTVIYPLERK